MNYENSSGTNCSYHKLTNYLIIAMKFLTSVPFSKNQLNKSELNADCTTKHWASEAVIQSIYRHTTLIYISKSIYIEIWSSTKIHITLNTQSNQRW